MDSFQIIVLLIATVVLILILTVIGITLSKNRNKVVFPPIANQCPDYWKVSSDGISCIIPMSGEINSGSIFSGGPTIPFVSDPANTANYVPGFNTTNSTINFNDPGWVVNKNSTCNKQIWAKKYKIVWDGVSNYNSC